MNPFRLLRLLLLLVAWCGGGAIRAGQKNRLRQREPTKFIPREAEDAADRDLRDAAAVTEQHRLAYPAAHPPAGDWRGDALTWLKRHVPDGIPAGARTLRLGGPGAVVPPGTAWTRLGPQPFDMSTAAGSTYGYGIVTGRVNTLAIDPSNPAVAYAGMPTGGLWKTGNCCSASTTWAPLWDGPDFPAQSVGAIALDPVNPQILYAGTGDSQATPGDEFGTGIFKSTDGGATWTQYGAALFSPFGARGAPASACCALAQDNNVKAIVIDPRDPNTIFAGASYGLFMSRDAGVTWARVDVVDSTQPPFDDDSQRITALLLDGGSNPSTLYVAVGQPAYSPAVRPGLHGGANGIYKTTLPAAGAPAFTLVSTPVNGWPANTGSGSDSAVGRIELAFNAAHTRMYAQVMDSGGAGGTQGAALGTWTTGDGGATWTLLGGSGQSAYVDCFNAPKASTQDGYDLFIGVDPADDHILYVGRTDFFKLTLNAGYTAVSVNAPVGNVYNKTCPGYGALHPDQHAFAWIPGTAPAQFLIGNDGGVYLGTGAPGGFTPLNASLGALQLYGGQLGRDFAQTAGATVQYAFAGAQDDGLASWDSSNATLQWQARANGGDGFNTAFDPIAGTLGAGRWMAEGNYGALVCSATGAGGTYGNCAPAYASPPVTGLDKRNWNTPILLDQLNCTNALCNNLIVGTSRVWASVSAGAPAWTATGATDLTKNTSVVSTLTALALSRSTPGAVIVGTFDGNFQWTNNLFTGANCTAAAANTASFACSVNGATAWVNLTGGNAVLPNRAIGGAAFDPATPLVFYAALGGFDRATPSTPGHLYRGVCAASPCTAANVTWSNASGNLPDLPFSSVAVNPANALQVFAGSDFGFFFTDNITQSPPLWKRYQSGLPESRIMRLLTDRGPSASPKISTTLAAVTYGRGVYVTQIGLPPVPAEVTASGAGALRASHGTSAGTVVLDFADQPGANGYNVYEGNLPLLPANPYTHGGAPGNVCAVTTTLSAGRRATPPAGLGSAGSRYYLITAYTGVESPSGFDSNGGQIPAAASSCAP